MITESEWEEHKFLLLKIAFSQSHASLTNNFAKKECSAHFITTTSRDSPTSLHLTMQVKSAAMQDMINVMNGSKHQIDSGIKYRFIMPRGNLQHSGRGYFGVHRFQTAIRVKINEFHPQGQTRVLIGDPKLEIPEIRKKASWRRGVLVRYSGDQLRGPGRSWGSERRERHGKTNREKEFDLRVLIIWRNAVFAKPRDAFESGNKRRLDLVEIRLPAVIRHLGLKVPQESLNLKQMPAHFAQVANGKQIRRVHGQKKKSKSEKVRGIIGQFSKETLE